MTGGHFTWGVTHPSDTGNSPSQCSLIRRATSMNNPKSSDPVDLEIMLQPYLKCKAKFMEHCLTKSGHIASHVHTQHWYIHRVGKSQAEIDDCLTTPKSAGFYGGSLHPVQPPLLTLHQPDRIPVGASSRALRVGGEDGSSLDHRVGLNRCALRLGLSNPTAIYALGAERMESLTICKMWPRMLDINQPPISQTALSNTHHALDSRKGWSRLPPPPRLQRLATTARLRPATNVAVEAGDTHPAATTATPVPPPCRGLSHPLPPHSRGYD